RGLDHLGFRRRAAHRLRSAPLMRLAILTHSTNPRGGVVHALAAAEALTEVGHQAVGHAPEPKGSALFRATACSARLLPAAPAPADTAGMVRQRVEDYVAHFADPDHRR